MIPSAYNSHGADARRQMAMDRAAEHRLAKTASRRSQGLSCTTTEAPLARHGVWTRMAEALHVHRRSPAPRPVAPETVIDLLPLVIDLQATNAELVRLPFD